MEMVEQAWGRIADSAIYGGVEKRTVRTWMKQGLPYSRTPSGRVMIRFADIDEFLASYRETPTDAQAEARLLVSKLVPREKGGAASRT
jgi:hypothetical protein